MASTPTPNGKFEKQGPGENSGNWGTGHLNPKTIEMIDEAIFGFQEVNIEDDDVTLVIPNYVTGNGRCASIELVGDIEDNDRTVTMPALKKVTTFRNNTTQGDGVVKIKVSGGENEITIPNGATRIIYNDGVEVYQIGADNALIGKCTYPIMVAAMTPLTTNGALQTQLELTPGNPEIVGLAFTGVTTPQAAQASFPLPKSWDRLTVTFVMIWTSAATDTDSVYFEISGVAVGDGDAIDTAYGAAVTITDAAQSAAYKKYVSAVSAAMTFAGSPANGDELYVKLKRDPTNGADAMTEDAIPTTLLMFYNTNAGNDA